MSEREPPRPGEPEPSPPQPEPPPRQPEPPVPQPGEPEPAPPPESPPPRAPFWDWSDLLVFCGLAVFWFAASSLVLLALHLTNAVWSVVAQFVVYLLLFLSLRLLFLHKYGEPFWNSLGWTNTRSSPLRLCVMGILLAVVTARLGMLMKTPSDPNSPMNKLLADRTSLILVIAVGVTVGPLCEELIFRGFLQPIVVRSLGAPAGVLLAAVPFGLLHLQQNRFYWQYGLLITLVGAVFGWVRYRTGSIKASTIMHAAYNATFLLALVVQRKEPPH